jgi:hypothetical protein
MSAVRILEARMLSGTEASDASAVQEMLERFVRNLRE